MKLLQLPMESAASTENSDMDDDDFTTSGGAVEEAYRQYLHPPQSILLTHYAPDPSSDQSSSWPPAHDAFVYSRLGQQCLALEIISGLVNDSVNNDVPPPRVIRKKNATILVPGSLRLHGDFSTVDLQLVPVDTLYASSSHVAATTSSPPTSESSLPASHSDNDNNDTNSNRRKNYMWRVTDVQFYQL
jgi:hypothetical protein